MGTTPHARAQMRPDAKDTAHPVSEAASSFIHLARWLAALVVLVYHVSTALVSVPDIMSAPHHPVAYVWWFFTPYAFAHEAVVVFFVLSGFLVGGAVVERRTQTQPWLRSYVLDRLIRIYIVLLPVLALTAVCDGFGRHYFPDPETYGLAQFADRFNLHLLLANALSLQGLWFEPFGTNDPMWSLGMEVWFYLLFPLLLLPWLRAYSRHWLRVLGLAFALVFLMSLPAGNYTRFGFCIWGAGVLARCLPAPLLRSRWVALVVFLAVSVVLRLAVRPPLSLSPPTKYLVDGVEALLFANLLLALRFDRSTGFAWARPAIHRRLAGFSYTLYGDASARPVPRHQRHRPCAGNHVAAGARDPASLCSGAGRHRPPALSRLELRAADENAGRTPCARARNAGWPGLNPSLITDAQRPD